MSSIKISCLNTITHIAFSFGTNCPKLVSLKHGSGSISPVAAYRSEQPGKNTLSENGKVKRGLCVTDNCEVKKIIECEIHEDNDELFCEPLDGSEMFIESTDMKTSMNMFLFNKSIFPLLNKIFNNFFANLEDELNGECLISTVIDQEINNDNVVLKYVETNAKWYGITYKEDLESLKKGINDLINSCEYNKNLWS